MYPPQPVVETHRFDAEPEPYAPSSSPAGNRLTRPVLESLSTDELSALADSMGIDIPPGLERIFLVEELLELDFGSESPDQENLDLHPEFVETAALPKQYNISFIDVMIRDPLWAFVFWEIKGHDREIHEKAPDFEGYCLRVIPLENREGGDNSFTVTVGAEDSAWYLGFPPAEGSYQVELCAIRKGEKTPITSSRPFRLPMLIEEPGHKAGLPKEIEAVYRNPLARLSGAENFSVIRSADRKSKRH
jgi:hypothetical protein